MKGIDLTHCKRGKITQDMNKHGAPPPYPPRGGKKGEKIKVYNRNYDRKRKRNGHDIANALKKNIHTVLSSFSVIVKRKHRTSGTNFTHDRPVG